MKKNILIGISLAALIGAGAAVAKDRGHMMDPMGDKTVTRAEAQAKAEDMFAKMDVNHDGKLDAADREAHMGQMFDQIDTNKDGAISKAEFIAAHKDGPEGMGPPPPGAPDKDGHRMGGGMMTHMMDMADANKDGAISKDEFVAAHLKMFDMADTNKDGKVTPEERKAAHAKMRKEHKGMQHGGMNGGHDMPPPPAG